MKFKYKVLLIIGFCLALSVGSHFIIRFMFSSLENQMHEKCRIEAMLGSRIMSDMMEFMISKGIVSETDIFDTKYVEIPKMNPKKYTTRYDSQIEKYIQKIQDEFLKDVDIDFAVLIDKNGYVPAHNTKYSQPPTGNFQKDLMKSRSKRIFSDNTSINQALNYKGNDTIRLLYYRDTGETMWLVSSPVIVRDKRWGYFMQGVSLNRLEILKNQMTIITVTSMFMIFCMSLVAIILFTPKKILAIDVKKDKLKQIKPE